MIEIRQLLPDELAALDVQPWQRMPEFELTDEYCSFLCDHSIQPTGVWLGGHLVAAGGALEIWPGRAEVWLLLAASSGKNFLAVHRAVRRFLQIMPHRRLETTCEIGWPQARRWLEMLGFERECTARGYMPSGRDIDIYVRVQ